MDPRFVIASTQELLDRAGLGTDELWNELNSCDGPDDAIRICKKYAALAKGVSA